MLLSKVRLTKRPTDKCTYHHREALVLLAMAQTSAEEGKANPHRGHREVVGGRLVH